MTLDCGTKEHLEKLIDELAKKGKQSRINLSLGLTTPSLSVVPGTDDLPRGARFADGVLVPVPHDHLVGTEEIMKRGHQEMDQPGERNQQQDGEGADDVQLDDDRQGRDGGDLRVKLEDRPQVGGQVGCKPGGTPAITKRHPAAKDDL